MPEHLYEGRIYEKTQGKNRDKRIKSKFLGRVALLHQFIFPVSKDFLD